MSGKLLGRFDDYIAKKKYSNRSEAIRDLVRDALVKESWDTDEVVAGVIAIVYDHHKINIMGQLTHIQHEAGDSIISTQHIHLDHHNCLEIIALKGRADVLKKMYDSIHALKGVKHATFSPTTLGKNLT